VTTLSNQNVVVNVTGGLQVRVMCVTKAVRVDVVVVVVGGGGECDGALQVREVPA
jgi:3-keto-L-gulonate-6-phosphate decarboxylase